MLSRHNSLEERNVLLYVTVVRFKSSTRTGTASTHIERESALELVRSAAVHDEFLNKSHAELNFWNRPL